MNKKLKSAIIGISLATGASFIPVIPEEATFIMAYQTTPETQVCSDKGEVATSTIKVNREMPCFEDDDGNGLITVGVSLDKQGNPIYYRIDEPTYAEMRKKDGSIHNPKKQYLESLIDSIKPEKVDAAIAFSAKGGTNAAGVVSATYAVTVSSGDTVIVINNFNTGGDVLSTVDYNGTSATFINKVNLPAKTEWVYLYYVANPAVGSNNVNLGYSASITMRSNSAAYSGTATTGIPEANTTNTATASTSVTTFLTTVADNSWIVLAGYSDGGTIGPSTGLTARDVQATALGLFDTNGPKTPAGQVTMVATSTSGTWGIIAASFQPPATGGGGGFGNLIIFD